jgi:CubicO group peptidase (beta-lactamase class C family)
MATTTTRHPKPKNYRAGNLEPLHYPFERDLAPNFREEWPGRAEMLERDLLVRGRLVKRLHWDHWGPDGFKYHGPIFDRTKMVESIIERMTDAGSVGFSWAIVQNGQLVDAGGMGDARTPSETDPRVMEATTRMVSASLAKPVCAVTVMKLVEQESLELDDFAYPLIEAAFPSAHSDVNDIRIRDLLTHRSGFNGPGTLSQFANALEQPLASAPDSITRYENWNYWFLAHVIEGVTGSPYVDVATETVLEPMTITTMNREVDDDAPCLYYAEDSVTNGVTWNDVTATAIGAYGWFASAIDWAKFLAYFRYDQVLSSSTRLTMLNAPETYFGFRHWNGQPRGSYYGHGGDFNSGGRWFHGGMVGFPDGVDAVLLTNSDDVSNPENVLMAAYHDAYA